MIITADILKAIAPGSKNTGYKLLPELAYYMNYWFPKFEIDTKGELCHFIAQAAHETDSFNSLEEYASGKKYEGRLDLKNDEAGEGVKFKGRGIFQTTGDINYLLLQVESPKYFNQLITFRETPKLLLKPHYAVWSACLYWDNKLFNDIANMSDDSKIWSKKLNHNLIPLEYITWRINGSIKTVPERHIFYERAKEIIK